MNEQEIKNEIERLRTANFVHDSQKNILVYPDTLKECGFSWRFRLNTKAVYNLNVFETMKKHTGAADLTIEYKRGLWVTLFFYPEQAKSC